VASVDVTLETEAAIERDVDIEKGLAETDVQLAELREKFTDSHPVIATLKHEAGALERRERPSRRRALDGHLRVRCSAAKRA
jgi:hypothetical protein